MSAILSHNNEIQQNYNSQDNYILQYKYSLPKLIFNNLLFSMTILNCINSSIQSFLNRVLRGLCLQLQFNTIQAIQYNITLHGLAIEF